MVQNGTEWSPFLHTSLLHFYLYKFCKPISGLLFGIRVERQKCEGRTILGPLCTPA